MTVEGNTRGLKPQQRKELARLSERRLGLDALVTTQLAERMTALSRETNRVIGVLIDRRGRIQSVMIGDHRRVYLPDIGRARGGGARFRGVRLVRTHLAGDPLTQDDLTDLSRLQLDAVATITASPHGAPGTVTWAHLIPDNPERRLWDIHTLSHPSLCPDGFSDFVLELEAEFERAVEQTFETHADRALLVYVRLRGERDSAVRIAELHELCRTAGVDVAETFTQARAALDPRTAVGQGALEEIELRALQLGAEVVVFGQDLSAAQMRTITDRTNLRVVDRTQLILDIFAQRAQSAVGKLQVELAQLKYTLPRLTGRGTAMSRLAGGIGGRGPGETRLEIDRRRARDRVRMLEDRIEDLRQQRELRRRTRQVRDVPVIAIVGYTNAGKSTLLNSLTRSDVLAEDKLFATLDPTSRRLRVPSEREVILTDTVGFIRDLPPSLREAFRATLEELAEADLLLHVVDASDPAWPDHVRSTLHILRELGVDDTPRLLVYNKVDNLTPDERLDLLLERDGIQITATDRASLAPLLDEIDRLLVAFGHGESIAPAPTWGAAPTPDDASPPHADRADDRDDGALGEAGEGTLAGEAADAGRATEGDEPGAPGRARRTLLH